MASLGELIREYAALDEAAAAHLHALVADWQLLADLSFADLLLWAAPVEGSGFVCLAHIRPVTGPTAHPDDQVGLRLTCGQRFAIDTAWAERRIVREGDPAWRGAVPVREEGVPVRLGNRVIAVVGRDTNLAAARVPSQLELAYLASAGDLLHMLAQGRYPSAVPGEQLPDAPRVGDGLLRLDAAGVVSFASPNALSAYRRLGLGGNLAGERLRHIHDQLNLSGAPVWRVLTTRRQEFGEAAGNGAEVLLRALPLLPAGEVLGALVLVHDVTEIRHRERALLSKDATIREIHHRVKNNLQTVAALLRLQGRRTSAPEAALALAEAVRRVNSIALVHETLSQTLEEVVEFDQIADQIAGSVVELAAISDRAELRREGSFGLLPATVATPLALVLSELVQNAVEHAYAGAGGALQLRVTRTEAGLEMILADDGEGLPAHFALEGSTRLGLQIVRSLVVGEMRGTLALRTRGRRGTEAVVAIPASQLIAGPLPPG